MKTLFIFTCTFLLFNSCKKQDNIEIYLTNERVESYDGIDLKSVVSDSTILLKLEKLYGKNLRYDSVKDRIIYMGRFTATEKDLQHKPFIINSEITGLSIQNSRIYFKESVQEKIYKSLNDWTEDGGMIGKQFVICVNGKIISNGYFDSMWNRFECKTNRILFYRDKIGRNNEIGFLIDSAKIPLIDMKNNSTLKTIFKDRFKD